MHARGRSCQLRRRKKSGYFVQAKWIVFRSLGYITSGNERGLKRSFKDVSQAVYVDGAWLFASNNLVGELAANSVALADYEVLGRGFDHVPVAGKAIRYQKGIAGAEILYFTF